MKFAQTIVAFVTSLAFINIVSTTPLNSNLIPGNIARDVATPEKFLNSSTSAEGHRSRRQTKEELQTILQDMNDLFSNLGANNRAEFTQKLIQKLYYNNGHYSYIVCHVKHAYSFNGTEGVDWAHYRTQFHNYLYDIVIGQAGWFMLQGDGGAINWGYSTAWAKSVTTNKHGTTVTFVES